MNLLLFVLANILILTIYSRSRKGGFLYDDHAISDMDFERRELVYSGRINWDDPANRLPRTDSAAMASIISTVSFNTSYPGWRCTCLFRAINNFLLEPRSLTHIGYLWTWRFDGFHPEIWHTVNMELHILNTWLVFCLTQMIRPEAAGVAALLFAIHPHQVAAVSYISGRAGLQACAFNLAGLLVLFRMYPFYPPVAVIVSAIAFMFAERSKEDGVIWALLLLSGFVLLRSFFG